MSHTSIYLQWRDRAPARRFRTGISLHSHTMHSWESLSFLPKVLDRFAVARAVFRNIEERHRRGKGAELDYGRAFWTPPLPAHDAYLLERGQIENGLGLESLVSITDHDSLEACSRLRLVEEDREIPMSLEWTVPYREAKFHVGVHNLPAEEALSIARELAVHTAEPRDSLLAGLLAGLHARPEVLLVLNHPLSDEGRVGNPIHEACLKDFLARFGRWVHALELNAMQPWRDNIRVAGIARELGFPLVSGGDRHCATPNGNVNLTNARSFAEFAAEIRRDRVSAVLFLPQCREPLPIRYVESLWQILRDYEDLPGRVTWDQRVFYRCEDGELRPLGALCASKALRVVRHLLAAAEFLASPRMRPALRLALLRKEEATL